MKMNEIEIESAIRCTSIWLIYIQGPSEKLAVNHRNGSSQRIILNNLRVKLKLNGKIK